MLSDAAVQHLTTAAISPLSVPESVSTKEKRIMVGHYVNPGDWFANAKFMRLNSTFPRANVKKSRRRKLLGLSSVGVAGPGKGQSDVVNSYLKKYIYNAVKNDMNAFLTAAVYEDLRPALSNHLIATLQDATMEK